VPTIGEADVSDSATQNADHHRLDHGQGEKSCHGRVNRVSAGGEHFSTSS
jgi:hypothetical protein